MLSYEDALAQLLQSIKTLGTERVSLDAALGRSLSAPIHAELDHPPFPQSAMDGFAIAQPNASLQFAVEGTAFAGAPLPQPLREGGACKVATGGPIPNNSFAVVPVEDAETTDHTLTIKKLPSKGQWIRPQGMDTKVGELLVDKSTKLKPGTLSNLAQQGIQEVRVFKVPRIGILTTGDEVCSTSDIRPAHKIFNSNQTLLRTLLQTTQGEIGQCFHAVDSPEAIRECLEELAMNHDLILTAGGASVGERDHLVNVIRQIGNIQFWKVKMRPGKPVFAGTVKDTQVLGLPGNPVSAFASFHLFARLVIDAICGVTVPHLSWTWLPLPNDVKPHPRRRDFLRATWKSQLNADNLPYELAPGQTSGHGKDLLQTDLLIEIPSLDERQIDSGSAVRAFFL